MIVENLTTKLVTRHAQLLLHALLGTYRLVRASKVDNGEGGRPCPPIGNAAEKEESPPWLRVLFLSPRGPYLVFVATLASGWFVVQFEIVHPHQSEEATCERCVSPSRPLQRTNGCCCLIPVQVAQGRTAGYFRVHKGCRDLILAAELRELSTQQGHRVPLDFGCSSPNPCIAYRGPEKKGKEKKTTIFPTEVRRNPYLFSRWEM